MNLKKENYLDILMVFPPGGILQEANFNYNLGSGYIIGYLKERGYKAEQFITTESLNIKECVKEIYKNNPKIIGFTVYNSNYMQSILISNELKNFNPNLLIIFGGPTPTVQDEEILESVKSVDICVRGEGEELLFELVSKLSANNFILSKVDLYEVNGITFRDNNKIVKNIESNILLNHQPDKYYLDNYPSPYLTKIIPNSEAFSTGIITARGCNQNCIYCNCAVMSKKKLFFHSTDRVIEELILIDESEDHKGPIPIYDDSFTIIPSRAKEICELIIENDLKMKLSCVTRCDKITDDLLDLMKQAGFVSLGVSLESAVPKVLRAIGKVSPPTNLSDGNFKKEIKFIQKVAHTTSYAKKIGFNHVFVSIMVGLPLETLEDIKTTLNFVKGLDIDAYQHNYFKIFKGTPIYDHYEKFGYKIYHTSKKNRIIMNIEYPFDIFQIKLEQKSMDEIVGKYTDYNTLKLLTFRPYQMVKKSFFRNVIINANQITKSTVKWLQSNISINGRIIHIYSDKNSFLLSHTSNKDILYGEISPTIYYESYYIEKVKDNQTLIPGRTIKFGDHIGFPIPFLSSTVLDDIDNSVRSFFTVLCVEKKLKDSKAVYNYLNKLHDSKEDLNTLIKHKVLPFFQNLCKWTQNTANCLKLESAILTVDNSIRICWFGDVIGNINQDFSEIENKLDSLREKMINERSCKKCQANEECVKCLFTFPISSNNYCDLRKSGKTTKSTFLIDSYNVLKDLVFNPDFHVHY